MDKIDFNTNWNKKLNCMSFSTIRKFNRDKFYISNLFEVYFKKDFFCRCIVVDEKRIDDYSDLTEIMCYLDTGYSKKETIEILKKIYSTGYTYSKEFNLFPLHYIILKKLHQISEEMNPPLLTGGC